MKSCKLFAKNRKLLLFFLQDFRMFAKKKVLIFAKIADFKQIFANFEFCFENLVSPCRTSTRVGRRPVAFTSGARRPRKHDAQVRPIKNHHEYGLKEKQRWRQLGCDSKVTQKAAPPAAERVPDPLRAHADGSPAEGLRVFEGEPGDNAVKNLTVYGWRHLAKNIFLFSLK